MLYLSEEEELISVSIFDINKPNLRKGKRLMSRREMNEAKAKWVRARDFIRNLEPTPLLEDFILWETPDSDPGNISFEHNVEQITEEMWGELLSLWRGIENGKKEVIVSVNTGSDYVRTILNYTVARTSDFEISDDEADPSTSGAFHEMAIEKGIIGEVSNGLREYGPVYYISIHLTAFEFDSEFSGQLWLDIQGAPNSDGSTYHHPRSALWNREKAKNQIEFFEQKGSFRNVFIFQRQLCFDDEDRCNQVLTELNKILS